MAKCDICGKETDVNYGNSAELSCKDCAQKYSRKKNATATWLKVIGVLLFIVSTVSSLFMLYYMQGSNFDMAIITLIVGIATMMLFFGIAEIIRLLTVVCIRNN